jgi:hypothetical protein
MADFRTSSQRERWIFQPHDLVSPGAQGLPFALLCFGTAWSLFWPSDNTARAPLVLCFADGEVGGGEPAGRGDPRAGWVWLVHRSCRDYLISSCG